MRPKKRLFWHLYPSFLAIIIITLVISSIYSSRSMEDFFLNQTAEDLKVRALLLQRQATVRLLINDEAAVNELCKVAGREASTRITVTLPDGRVIGDSFSAPEKMENHADRPEIREAVEGRIGTSIRYSTTMKNRMMYVATPLIHDGQLLATLRTAITVSRIDEQLNRIRMRFIFGGIVIALIVAGISLLASRRISRPVEEMKIGADRFSRGDFDHKLPTPDTVEMAALADSLNQMAARLDDRIKTIVRHRNELEAVLSSMVEGVLAVDRSERVLFNNQAVIRLFDLKVRNLAGKTIQEVARSPQFHRFVQQALTHRETAEGTFTLYTPEERILHFQNTPLGGGSGEHIGTLFVLNDVTEIKRLENMRRDFAANVSHEIKTPLTAIKGFVETLIDVGTEDPSETQKFLSIVQKHVDRLAAIVEDLKRLSQIERADEADGISLARGSIAEVIQAAVENCRNSAQEKRIQIFQACDENLEAPINAQLLEHALSNLIDNAIAFSPPEGRVDVTGATDGSEVILRVQDEGIGIARRHQERVFERFYRVDEGRSRDKGGTGLGLAIVKHVVLAHNGRIMLDSAPGKGSRFEIRLPVP